MGCSRGKANPDAYTRIRLFADSAGHCQNPSCLLPLFRDTGTERIHIAEMAHIFSAQDAGPRTGGGLTQANRGAFENLIMLCPTCHTTVDKAEKDFPDSLMREWKASHASKIAIAFGAKEYEDRAAARRAIEPAMLENFQVHQMYGPEGDALVDPESERAAAWKTKMLSTIIPNNERVLAILDANRRHLVGAEPNVVEQFRQHIRDLESKHIEDGVITQAQRFPSALSEILKD